MKVSDVLSGRSVVTVSGQDSVEQLLAVLAEHRIGAVVVSDDGEQVTGIVSERDVMRGLDASGSSILQGPICAIMVSQVHTCAPGDDVIDLARTMTEHRFRHVPVVVDGKLTGIVSIGDVVKARIEALEAERDHLESYISQ